MSFTLLITAILTGIALVAAGMIVAKLISALVQCPERRGLRMWFAHTWTFANAVQGWLLPVRHPVPDVRHRDSIPLSLGSCRG